MAHSTSRMQPNDLNAFEIVVQWVAANWKEISGFALASQFIDRFFKWLTKRSEARIKEIYTEQYETQVKPEISKLTKSIDELKESIWGLKNQIK